MRSIYNRLKKAFPFVGTRAATEDDLFEFCADRGIEIVFSRDVSAGVYVVYDGEHFIFLNNKLSGRRLLHVAFHEIGHFLFHAPTQSQFAAQFYGLDHWRRRNECEAEAVAAWLLLPIADMEDVVVSGSFKHDLELAELVATRLEIYKFEKK